MSYTRPPGSAADAAFSGRAYTRPAGDAADASWQTALPAVIGSGAVVLPAVLSSAAASHGVAGDCGVQLGIAANGVGTASPGVTGDGAVALDAPAVAGLGAHGIAGAGQASIGHITASAAAAHGVAGAGAAAWSLLSAGQGAHGVRGAAVAVLAVAASGVAMHPRYSLRGEVRDGAVLVNRTVRAYRRDTGALVGEQETTAGRFDMHAGFVPLEHYILPIDLSDGAADFAPPVANRVLSVLVQD